MQLVLRTSTAAVFALSCVVVPEASAHHRYHYGHYGHYGGHGGFRGWGYAAYGYPYAYGPGFYPSVGFGVGYYPFSIGVGYVGGPPDPRGSLRTQVAPRQTEVFIDGYYAGLVDDFDGSFQKLRLDPGPHTVTLYLDGHELYEETVYSTLGSTIKIRHEMEPLAPGEPMPVRPGTGYTTPPATASAPPPPPPSAPPSPLATTTAPEYGTLLLRSQPGEAEVWIDGELWTFPGGAAGPAGSERLNVHLPAGPHELELRKEGYESFRIGIEIRGGEAEALNVRLAPSPP
jgi:hypothetical protein